MHLPRLMLLGILVLSSASSSSADSPKVETLRALCNRLAKETGQTIEVDRGLAGLPIFADRRSLSTHEILKAVAFGYRASLVSAKNGWRISRTGEDRKGMLEEAQALWRERVSDWLAQEDQNAREASHLGSIKNQVDHYQTILSDQIKKVQQEGPNATINVKADPNDFTPAGVLYRDIFRNIGPERLFDLGAEERRVWSNKPEGDQILCPNGDGLLRAFAQRDRDFRTGLQASSDIATPVRFTFRQVGGTLFDLRVYDSNGQRLARFSGPPSYFAMAGPVLRYPGPLAAAYGKDPLTWKTLDAASLKVAPFLGPHALISYLPKSELPTALTEPDKVDPLNFSVRLGLGSIAENCDGKGFVAVPNDEMLMVAEACTSGSKMNVEGFDHVLQWKWQYERKVRDGVTVLRARDPYFFERSTVDRLSLANQTSLLLSKPKIFMRDIAAAYLGIFPNETSRVAERIFEDIVYSQPHSHTNALNLSGTELCWMGAGLAASGNTGRTATVNPQLEPIKTLLRRGLNDGWLKFQSVAKLADSQMDLAVAPPSNSSSLNIRMDSSTFDELCSLGVAPQGNVEAQNMSYEPAENIGGRYGGMLTALPRDLYLAHPELVPSREEALKRVRTFGNYHAATRERLSVSLSISPTLFSRLSMEEIQVRATNLAFEDLPPQVQKKMLETTMEVIGAFMKGAPPGQSDPSNSPGIKAIPPVP